MRKLTEDWREKGKKFNFPLRFLYVTLKNFSKISNLNWFFAQTRKNLPLGFLISFRIIKDYQEPTKLILFMKIFKMLQVSIDFSTNFLIIFRQPSEPHTNADFQSFLIFP